MRQKFFRTLEVTPAAAGCPSKKMGINGKSMLISGGAAGGYERWCPTAAIFPQKCGRWYFQISDVCGKSEMPGFPIRLRQENHPSHHHGHPSHHHSHPSHHHSHPSHQIRTRRLCCRRHHPAHRSSGYPRESPSGGAPFW